MIPADFWLRGTGFEPATSGLWPDELPAALPREILVPETGVEPARDHSHGILSPGRLPIPPLRRFFRSLLEAYLAYHAIVKMSIVFEGRQIFFVTIHSRFKIRAL